MPYLIYLYSSPIKRTPRYVGKAHSEGTMLRHANGQSHNKAVKNMVAAAKRRGIDLQPEVICSEIKDNLSANAIERFWIAVIGRADQRKGTLFNGTDGGDGVTGRRGFKQAPRSAETREKISRANKGKSRQFAIVTCPHCGKEGKENVMHIWHFDRCKHNPDKEKVKEAQAKQNQRNANVSKKRKGLKQEIGTCPHCGKQGGIGTMKNWHFDNCKHNPDKEKAKEAQAKQNQRNANVSNGVKHWHNNREATNG